MGCSTWTGGVRRAPLRVADGDGMDPPALRRGRAPGNTPEMRNQLRKERQEMDQEKQQENRGE